jgi:hypothetical protein
VCLSLRPVTGMTPVLVGFVDHIQALGRESFRQLSRDDIFCLHGSGRKRHLRNCQDLKAAAATKHNNRL